MSIPTLHPSWTHTPPQRRRRARISALATIPSPALPESDPLAELPPVQRAVARLFAEGWASADIASELGIRNDTVRAHLGECYKTFGIDGASHGAGRLLARMVGAWAGREMERRER